jgi:hypothetical protein
MIAVQKTQELLFFAFQNRTDTKNISPQLPFKFTYKFLFLRLFGKKCNGCLKYIGQNELVLQTDKFFFHLECFKCSICERVLLKGDEYILKDDKILCKQEFNFKAKKTKKGLQLNQKIKLNMYDTLVT